MTTEPAICGYKTSGLDADYRMPEPPNHIVFGVTNFCNLSCAFCDVGTKGEGLPFYERLVNNPGMDGHHDRRVVFPRKDLLPVVEQIAAFIPNGFFSIIHAEPLIHPEIAQIVEDFTSRGLDLSITTNGTVLKKKAESLVRARLNNINVSIDGPEDMHDAVRGKGSFAAAYEGLKELVRWKKELGSDRPRIRVQSVLMGKSVGRLTEFIKFWRDDPLGRELFSLTFQHMYYADQKSVDDTLAESGFGAKTVSMLSPDLLTVDMAVYAAERDKLEQLRQEGLPFTVIMKPDLPSTAHADAYFHHPDVPVVRDRCEFPLHAMYVNVDGKVTMSPRCAFDEITLGNVYDKPLAEIWNDHAIRGWRKFLGEGPVPAVCNRCCVIYLSKRAGPGKVTFATAEEMAAAIKG